MTYAMHPLHISGRSGTKDPETSLSDSHDTGNTAGEVFMSHSRDIYLSHSHDIYPSHSHDNYHTSSQYCSDV